MAYNKDPRPPRNGTGVEDDLAVERINFEYKCSLIESKEREKRHRSRVAGLLSTYNCSSGELNPLRLGALAELRALGLTPSGARKLINTPIRRKAGAR